MEHFSDNLRYLRKLMGWTQQEAAKRLEISRVNYNNYERGAQPNLETLIRMARIFSISLDQLLSRSLKSESSTGGSYQSLLRPEKILSIVTDQENEERIVLIPQKASAGYLSSYSDPEYWEQLPSIRLPFKQEGSFRAFQLKGDSMFPRAEEGDIIIGRYLDHLSELKDGSCCVLVLQQEGIVYKRVYNRISKGLGLLMVSDNPAYEPYSVELEQVREIWIFYAILSFRETGISNSSLSEPILRRIENKIDSIEKKLNKK
jgi:transcriptional regulator with XRE-family HTH domain